MIDFRHQKSSCAEVNLQCTISAAGTLCRDVELESEIQDLQVFTLVRKRTLWMFVVYPQITV